MIASPPPRVACIGGTEATGVAGLAVDIRTVTALGGHALPVVTAVTAQSPAEAVVQAVEPEVLRAQLDAALAAAPAVLKVGLVADAAQARMIAECARAAGVPLVLDPVQANSHGHGLSSESGRAVLAPLLAAATLVTPNRDECDRLAGPGAGAAGLAGQLGVAVLETGGHRGEAQCRDEYVGEGLHFSLVGPRIETAHQRGTGCCLAAAIATALALGFSLADAVVLGKASVGRALEAAYPVGPAGGALRPADPLPAGVRLPALFVHGEVVHGEVVYGGGVHGEGVHGEGSGPGENPAGEAFADCGAQPLGIYPVVDRTAWLQRLLPCGISTVQLRVKDLAGAALEREVREAVAVAARFGARLFVNDHWQLALQYRAYGVHLGQEDLATADLAALRGAGVRLGISTHCVWELARALALRPSYVACGPVYPTTSKIMPWAAHGLAGLRQWRRWVSGCPLVAIGGIDAARVGPVVAAGADGVAMISALTGHPDPESRARRFVQLFEEHRA